MRGWWLICMVLWAQLAWGQGYVLDTSGMVPAQAVADWLGGAVMQDDATQALMLAAGEHTVWATLNRRAATVDGRAVTLPAPAFALDGEIYVPARTVAAAFKTTLTWSTQPTQLTLSRRKATPLVLRMHPFPRPDCTADDTLAGLTPGDHVALAVALWGDPAASAAGRVPQATDYQFLGAAAERILLFTSVREDRILTIGMLALPEGQAPGAAELQRTATRRGLALLGDGRKVYGEPYSSQPSESGAHLLAYYQAGSLRLLARYSYYTPTQHTQLVELRLFPRTWPERWLAPPRTGGLATP